MAEFIVMPKLGFDMREGVLVRWLKKIGESINKGEVVAEIESDKATLELETQVAGTLLHFLESEGTVVPIGAHLAIVGAVGEDISSLTGGVAPAMPKTEHKEEEVAATPLATTSAEQVAVVATATIDDAFPGGVKASPVARRMAQEKGVDLRLVMGTGPDGRIRRRDVEGFVAPMVEKMPAQPQPTVTTPPTADTTELPLSRLRQAIARRMTESKTTIPHFYVTTEVDMTAALDLRKQINTLLPDAEKTSVNDLIVKAAALALRDFPNLNSSFAGDKLLRHNQINIGSAVAVEGGLLTVVQKNTDRTPLKQIATENKTLIAKARAGKVHPDDITGSTFTVSNLGAYDVDHFIAIINPPEAAILAVGSAKQQPVVVNGQLTVGMRMKVTLSADHRVSDGAEVAQFLQQFKAIMEQPLLLLI